MAAGVRFRASQPPWVCACEHRVGASARFEQRCQFSEGPSSLGGSLGWSHWESSQALPLSKGAEVRWEAPEAIGNHLRAIWGTIWGTSWGPPASYWKPLVAIGAWFCRISREMLQNCCLGTRIVRFSTEMLQKSCLGARNPRHFVNKRLVRATGVSFKVLKSRGNSKRCRASLRDKGISPFRGSR